MSSSTLRPAPICPTIIRRSHVLDALGARRQLLLAIAQQRQAMRDADIVRWTLAAVASKLILEPRSNSSRYTRMDDIVGLRRGFVAQPGNIVVLDVIPFDVGNIEHIQGDQPLFRLLKANLGIDRGV